MIVKACLNGVVHETDKKLHCLCIPRGLQLTFIHSVRDLREGTFLIGGGGPGLRRGGSFVNILQIWEGQTCFICNWGRVIVSWQGKNYSMSVS